MTDTLVRVLMSEMASNLETRSCTRERLSIGRRGEGELGEGRGLGELWGSLEMGTWFDRDRKRVSLDSDSLGCEEDVSLTLPFRSKDRRGATRGRDLKAGC